MNFIPILIKYTKEKYKIVQNKMSMIAKIKIRLHRNGLWIYKLHNDMFIQTVLMIILTFSTFVVKFPCFHEISEK